MRSPLRERGRFASLSSLSVIRCAPGAPYPIIVIDADGLPLYPYTKWFALRIAVAREYKRRPAESTIETYLGFLLPFAGYLHTHNVPWNNPPDVIREQLETFNRSVLHLNQHTDHKLEGTRLRIGKDTLVTESSLGCMLAAWRDFYRTMRAEKLYVYSNPMTSELLERLNEEHRKHIRAAGAPGHAGIRSETRAATGRRPNAWFRVEGRKGWQLRQEYTDTSMLTRLARAFDALLSARGLSLRDKLVLLLLRYTGARVHEICLMTAGGYRSLTTAGIEGQALVVNKGGGGVEEKPISFAGRPDIIRGVAQYVRTERSRVDPQHRKKVEALADDEPLFLTQRGTPFNYDAFRGTWRRIYPRGKTHVPNGFSIHDLRHLLVSELLLTERQKHGASAQAYAEAKESIRKPMGWQSLEIINVYDHALSTVDALALLTALQQRGVGSPEVFATAQSDRSESAASSRDSRSLSLEDEAIAQWIAQA